MPFDQAFFDELGALDATAADSVLPSRGYRPSVQDLADARVVSAHFLTATRMFVGAMAREGKPAYRLDEHFRAYAHHITNFTAGRAFRSQYNVAFTSDPVSGERYARVGIGYSLGPGLKPEGLTDYTNLVERLLKAPQTFDAVMARLGGGYAELAAPVHGPTAQALLAATPRRSDDWRFFGVRIPAAEIIALPSAKDFAKRCISVFQSLEAAGFKP